VFAGARNWQFCSGFSCRELAFGRDCLG